MAPEPKDYQHLAITNLSGALLRMSQMDAGLDRLAILNAPTGSGKTLVSALTLRQLSMHPAKKDFIVLWFSPGKGNLHKQTATALDSFLLNSPLSVTVLDDRSDIVANRNPSAGQVFVVNWEKIWQVDNGVWVNKLMQPGDGANLFTMLENSSKSGLDLICVIDESHTQLGGENTSHLISTIKSFRPFIQFEVSATPSRKPHPDLEKLGIQFEHVIPFSSVVEAEMVKKSVQLNADIAEIQENKPELDLQNQVLWAAWEKTQQLKEAYAEQGSLVTPLLLIQYPDGKRAEAIAQIAEDFLRARGLVKGETYATWLSGEHSEDLDTISKNESPYQALIFKQAIATGWDCPRAQVLVQFRRPDSKTFQIQTLGRLMRSPEQKHYDNEVLNSAYVYSDIDDVEVKVTSDDPNYVVRDFMLVRGKEYPSEGLVLASVFQPRRREYHYPLAGSIDRFLGAELKKAVGNSLPKIRPKSTSSQILTNATLESERILGGQSAFFAGLKKKGTLSELIVQSLFDELLTLSIGPYSSREQTRPRIKNALIRWFKEQDSGWQPDEIQHFCLGRPEIIINAIDAACVEAAKDEESRAVIEARSKRRTNFEWEVPENELIAPTQWEESEGKGNIWNPPMVKLPRSNPELRFEVWLGLQVQRGFVLWWWKNGIRDEKYLGIPYDYKDDLTGNPSEEITYPDYLVMDTNNCLWCLEVKDIDDSGGESGGRTHSKARGIAKWVREMNTGARAEQIPTLCQVNGGIVVPNRRGNVQIKIGDSESWAPPSQENWDRNSGWSALFLGQA